MISIVNIMADEMQPGLIIKSSIIIIIIIIVNLSHSLPGLLSGLYPTKT